VRRWIQKTFANGRPVLTIEDLGKADSLLNDKQHFAGADRKQPRTPATGEKTQWNGWLGRYQAAMEKAVEEQQRARPERGR